MSHFTPNILVCEYCKCKYCPHHFDLVSWQTAKCSSCKVGENLALKALLYANELRFIKRNEWAFVDQVEVEKELQNIGTGLQIPASCRVCGSNATYFSRGVHYLDDNVVQCVDEAFVKCSRCYFSLFY